jgi:hypothetical protein
MDGMAMLGGGGLLRIHAISVSRVNLIGVPTYELLLPFLFSTRCEIEVHLIPAQHRKQTRPL